MRGEYASVELAGNDALPLCENWILALRANNVPLKLIGTVRTAARKHRPSAVMRVWSVAGAAASSMSAVLELSQEAVAATSASVVDPVIKSLDVQGYSPLLHHCRSTVSTSKWLAGGLAMNLSPLGGTTPSVTPLRSTSAVKDGAVAPPPACPL